MIRGIFFDQDGVIADTERDGHRVAFNRTFEEFGFGFSWDIETYGRLLAIGGGKERFLHYVKQHGIDLPGDLDELVAKVHARKTELFVQIIEEGGLVLRPGIRRFMEEAAEAGLIIGICTTSNGKTADAIRRTLLPHIPFSFILAGDVVSRKKPDPEIYRMALERTGLTPDSCIVVEDSRNGFQAASGAGIPVVVTVNGYTKDEDVTGALLVLSCLGDEAESGKVLFGTVSPEYDGALRLQDVEWALRERSLVLTEA